MKLSAVDAMDKEIDNLPKATYFNDAIYKWEGFWFHRATLKGAKSIVSNFGALDDDVILASVMKTGTTWLKSLCVSIMECKGGAEEDSLVKNNPHTCILSLESLIFAGYLKSVLSGISSPRFFHTHLAYSVLPDSIKKSKCKIIYITRNPKDTLVSAWHFFNKVNQAKEGDCCFEETVFDPFCKDVYPSGPFYDHVLEYWNESLKMPDKILFLKYEELKRDPQGQVKKLAALLGKPLEDDEVEEVLRRSSLERLKNLEINSDDSSTVYPGAFVPNSSFFRTGAVGGWKNYFTPREMQMDKKQPPFILRLKRVQLQLHCIT